MEREIERERENVRREEMPPAMSLPSSSLLLRSASLFSPVILAARHSHHHTPRPSHRQSPKHLSLTKPSSTSSSLLTSSTASVPKLTKKAHRESPESLLRHNLGMCSKRGDVHEALRLYDYALAASIRVSLHEYNVLLYLCSHPSASADEANRAIDIFRQMSLDGVDPNEATFTSLARLAAGRHDPDLAFQFIKTMSSAGITPRLRSYGPALFGFCEKGHVDRAHEVESHMVAAGVSAEEPELTALLQLNSKLGRGDDVYRLLHRLRAAVRKVSETTAEVIKGWFQSEAAGGVGVEEWDAEKIKEGMVRGGGWWHGQGWMGKGEWNVSSSEMDNEGFCRQCGEKMVSIDIDPVETEEFAKSLAELARKKEVKADFAGFQAWLDRHGPFDAVIDGANVGLYNQHDFSFIQLNSVVNGIREMSPSKKLPLVVLHSKRVKSGLADNSKSKWLLESWRSAGALYATPPGPNDDWYWLYAAVSCKCLLVTNDEMRDHLFALFGDSFFPRWKEKHQVRLTVSRNGPTFHMPAPYSIVIQESELGSWHVPTITGDDIEMPRKWICATRNSLAASSRKVLQLLSEKFHI
ncbi:Proteinaceous RNase P 1, chloroplastic/mitochondrial [Apostasia shenzhenica]|uniref:ribonuclease P n=1 Tax=Apostasia shenzhenica TaxID=1088818 RepID=A0A2I0BAB1_9ASPA|nr:Proteinaceous RNase P 1, chloroplastic/mitochondrial [Apostasia shenzhenica]